MTIEEFNKLPEDHPFKKYENECIAVPIIPHLPGCIGMASNNNEVTVEMIRRSYPALLKKTMPEDQVGVFVYGVQHDDEYRSVLAYHVPKSENRSEGQCGWGFSMVMGPIAMKDEINRFSLRMSDIMVATSGLVEQTFTQN